MQDILFEYELNPTTWAYISALMVFGVFFKFHRFLSIRNLDLVGLVTYSPGLLMVFHGIVKQLPHLIQWGYAWLLGVSLLYLIRLLLDPIMVRRPLLEPNLNASGLTFTGASLMVFLTANVLASNPPPRLEYVLAAHDPPPLASPGFLPFHYVSSFANSPTAPQPKVATAWEYPSLSAQVAVSRTLVLIGQAALILGMVWIGYRHFDNIEMGIAAASLYLLLPYTAQMVGRVNHALPGALLIWAVAMYRRPAFAGMLLGLAGGLAFYPLFLLPLWCSFYWRRGLFRFLGGFVAAIVALLIVLAVVAPDSTSLLAQLKQMFGSTLFARESVAGFWKSYQTAYRIPVLAVFAVLSATFALWPAQKNLGTLLTCSAAVMLTSQFCQLHQGGLTMAWFLPLVVLTIFRPNLEDRMAVSAVIEGRTTWPVLLARRLRRKT